VQSQQSWSWIKRNRCS